MKSGIYNQILLSSFNMLFQKGLTRPTNLYRPRLSRSTASCQVTLVVAACLCGLLSASPMRLLGYRLHEGMNIPCSAKCKFPFQPLVTPSSPSMIVHSLSSVVDSLLCQHFWLHWQYVFDSPDGKLLSKEREALEIVCTSCSSFSFREASVSIIISFLQHFYFPHDHFFLRLR